MYEPVSEGDSLIPKVGGSHYQPIEFIKLLFHNNRCVQSACPRAISDHIHPHGIKYFGAKTFQITAPVTQLRLAGISVSHRHINLTQTPVSLLVYGIERFCGRRPFAESAPVGWIQMDKHPREAEEGKG
ncbi:hypothetical protein SAY87_022236 [Trapa incisa]|uniref:Uncharacterized protein n=1 Tax=Trapa incisa TaxID=236973 RepID=A0AAN7PTK8_9MYRT|nr:hypothetical protein SAY87_022236 [Trapa incisa]